MRRREFIALMGASVTWPFAALAQQPGRTYRLGGLFPAPRDNPANAAWFDELKRRGFIEGQNLTIEYRAYGQHVDLLPQYAAELVEARVDVIAIAGDEAVRAVQQATKTIPIVAFAGDLLESGLVGRFQSSNHMGCPKRPHSVDGRPKMQLSGFMESVV